MGLACAEPEITPDTNVGSLQLGRIITQGRRYIAEVDGLRFVAISGVVACHLSGYTILHHMTGAVSRPWEVWMAKILDLGYYGVQLFFVLSGFLLALPFAKWRLGLGGKPSRRTYYLRRLTRLEPPYMLAMLILFAGGFLAFGVHGGVSHWPNLVASLIYQHNLIFGERSLITGVAWSLEIEVQFYLLAPLLAAAFSIRHMLWRRGILIAVMTMVPMLRNLLPSYWETRYCSLPWFVEFFAAGFLLADFYLTDWDERPRHSYTWDAASALAWPALAMLVLEQWPSAVIAPMILLAYVSAFRGKVGSWFFSRPLVTTIGGMCYSLYLLHFSIISVTGRIARRFEWGGTFTSRLILEALVGIPAVLAVSGIYFVLIERPCMVPDWPSKLRDRMRNWRTRGLEFGRETTV
jgi:peptidoglycan/LPS O-acetylase OafA/YrhL